MNAFVPSLAPRRAAAASLSSRAAICPSQRTACRPGAPCCQPNGLCSRTSAVPATTPFFASSAFGSAVQARLPTNAPRTGVRMDVTVVVGDNEPVEAALRRFKKDVTRSGHLFELRRRRYFETNTEKRIRKAAAARRKARMAARSGNRNNNNNNNNNNNGSSSNNNNSGGSFNRPQN